MKGKVKRKVVSSGRLTGAVEANRLRGSGNEVTTLHKGLDRCAVLLSGILQAEKAGSPSFPRMVKSVKSSASLGRNIIKEPPTKTAPNHQKSSPSATATPGVKLHPPQKQPHALPVQGPSRGLSRTVPPPQTSVLLSMHQTSSLPLHHPNSPRSQTKAERDGEQEAVHVRDVKIQSPEADRKGARGGEESGVDARVKMVQSLLSELRTLITGQGSVTEKLLSHLEQTVSSPQTNIQTEYAQELSSLQSENAQLRRRVKILNQQLKEREKVEKHQNLEILCTSDALSLQEELFTARSRLRELQDDLAGLQKSLQYTQSQLRGRECTLEERYAIVQWWWIVCVCHVTQRFVHLGLEATRSRLMNSEQEKSEPASLSQQRPEEIRNLSRLFQSSSVHCPSHRQRGQDPPSNPGITTQPEVEFNSTLSQCDVESMCSDWSMRSESSFNTRDEAAFRDSLAALDASIASLQKTIRLEVRR
ncbi:coiled-coil domain-containing protein 14 isoform X2 [Parambassis ranga]|uniref:Coiled-coil domain-containing protein 14 isoform X2 n=1 Tax=Parambassis ranga TaxID=210632 RepID=A0A6P7HJH7_9TELE|nr:coiled-coil domain-containing protein 14 isoform X2 [Parambassis ranga]